MPFPTLQFPFYGLSDQVKPGLTVHQGGVQSGNRFVIERKRKPHSPKFFSSHGSFFVCTLLTGRNIVYTL